MTIRGFTNMAVLPLNTTGVPPFGPRTSAFLAGNCYSAGTFGWFLGVATRVALP
jgi:hypothetical protein